MEDVRVAIDAQPHLIRLNRVLPQTRYEPRRDPP
jgi:hypothetical protein